MPSDHATALMCDDAVAEAAMRLEDVLAERGVTAEPERCRQAVRLSGAAQDRASAPDETCSLAEILRRVQRQAEVVGELFGLDVPTARSVAERAAVSAECRRTLIVHDNGHENGDRYEAEIDLPAAPGKAGRLKLAPDIGTFGLLEPELAPARNLVAATSIAAQQGNLVSLFLGQSSPGHFDFRDVSETDGPSCADTPVIELRNGEGRAALVAWQPRMAFGPLEIPEGTDPEAVHPYQEVSFGVANHFSEIKFLEISGSDEGDVAEAVALRLACWALRDLAHIVREEMPDMDEIVFSFGCPLNDAHGKRACRRACEIFANFLGNECARSRAEGREDCWSRLNPSLIFVEGGGDVAAVSDLCA